MSSKGLGSRVKLGSAAKQCCQWLRVPTTFYLPTGQGEPRGWVTVLRECRDSTARQAWVRQGHWRATKRGVTESLATDN